MFWEVWGLQNHFYEKWIFSQSRTKTSTKTHIANLCQKYPNHCLLVHNLHTMKKKRKKGGKFFSLAGRFGLRLWFLWACVHVRMYALQPLSDFSSMCVAVQSYFFRSEVFFSDGSLFCLLVRIKCVFFAHVRVCTLENYHRSTCLHVYMLHGCIRVYLVFWARQNVTIF